ncbi:MAG: DNA polymerase Y family protein [Proteobacteria bacterium]|nr:DNA polymerase Y family protein [Pseudomonadota bacterium]
MSASSSPRMLSLWLPRFATDRIRRLREASSCRGANHSASKTRVNALMHREPGMTAMETGIGELPLVVAGKRGNADVLVAVDETAERLGLTPGLALAQARAMHPALDVVPEDASADAELLESIADWCLRYTPLIACDAPDGLLLDISGCAHLYGGERPLVADLGRRLAAAGFAYRIAIAGTIGAAFAAARDGRPDAYANGEERDILCPLPLGALRLPPPMVASLGRVGLKCIGDIIDMPRAPLTARFGGELLRQLDRALGREHEPLTPRLPVAPYVAEKRFHDPIAREEDVLGTVEMLAVQLAAALERRGDGARRIELTLFRTDGALRRIAAGTARPLRDPADMRALFAERLNALADELDPGFGFDMARLSVLVAEPAPPEQIGIGAAEDVGELVRLVDRLSARLGAQRVRRAVAQDSHIPEVASVSLPAQATGTDDGWAAFHRYRAEAELAPRPLRLLSQPEPIEVVAEVPDGPPLRFKWRRALHDVAAADGPERIEGVWWHPQPSEDIAPAGNRARDYFRVEDKGGHRFWLFRAGLYRDLTRADVAQGAIAAPAWFVHGMFG